MSPMSEVFDDTFQRALPRPSAFLNYHLLSVAQIFWSHIYARRLIRRELEYRRRRLIVLLGQDLRDDYRLQHRSTMKDHRVTACTLSSTETVMLIPGTGIVTFPEIAPSLSAKIDLSISSNSSPTVFNSEHCDHIAPARTHTITQPSPSPLSTPSFSENSSSTISKLTTPASSENTTSSSSDTTSTSPSRSLRPSPPLFGSTSFSSSEKVSPSNSRTTTRTVRLDNPITSTSNGTSPSSRPSLVEMHPSPFLATIPTSLPPLAIPTSHVPVSDSISITGSIAPQRTAAAARVTASTVVTQLETITPAPNTTSGTIYTTPVTFTPQTPNTTTVTIATVAVGALKGGDHTHVIEIVETCLLAVVAAVVLAVGLWIVRRRWKRRSCAALYASETNQAALSVVHTFAGNSVAGRNNISSASTPTPRSAPYRAHDIICDRPPLHASDGKEDVERDADYHSTAPATSVRSDASPRTSTTASYINALCPETSSSPRTARALPAPPSPAPPYVAHTRPGSSPGAQLAGSRPPDIPAPIVPVLSWYPVSGADPVTSIAVPRASMEEGYAGHPARWVGTPVSSTYLLEDVHPNADAIQAAIHSSRAHYYMEPLHGSRRTYVSSFDAGCSEVDVPGDSDVPPEYRRSPE
ncbi:hypothetical protein C8Q73DRAFT_35448 [Cubamyces lactineus]|nr:hypothetical protein C8Q73DRAFT_35448 [Cubamyces lactineus]